MKKGKPTILHSIKRKRIKKKKRKKIIIRTNINS